MMLKKRIDQKPSETALFAALRRTIANKEFKSGKLGPDDLAEYFLPPHFRFFLKFKRIRGKIKNKLNGLLPGLNEYMIARTAFFDRLFLDALKNKTPQIVLLGAGYDSRAYRFAKLNQGTRIFELDAPPTQDRKKKCIRKAQIDISENVTFVPINFNQESIKNKLEKAGYKHDQNTLFIWEGVSYYLELESVETTLEFVRQASHEETFIGFDYTTSISDDNMDNFYGVREFTQAMNHHHANEELMFSIDDSKTASFLEQRGLKIVSHLDNKEIERTFLLDENGSQIGQITGHFRFVLASANIQET
jgi:methyltransferase (TIGR00027 family)